MTADIVVRGGRTRHRVSAVTLPGDKSICHRVLIAATAMPGVTRIANLNRATSVQALVTALQTLGVAIDVDAHTGMTMVGPLSTVPSCPVHLFLGGSSTAARLLLGYLAGRGFAAIIDGDASLRARPMSWVVEPLRQLGAEISYLEQPGHLPVRLNRSRLSSGAVTMQVASAQARSTMAFAAMAGGITVDITHPQGSRDHTVRLFAYLDIPLEIRPGWLRVRGTRPRVVDEFRVPCDPSALAYPVAAHLLSRSHAAMSFREVCLNPTRIGFLKLVSSMGAGIAFEAVDEQFGEPVGQVIVEPPPDDLIPFAIEDQQRFHTVIDEVPVAFAVATRAAGRSVLLDGAELAFKETNRLETTRAMLDAFGASVQVRGYDLYVDGGTPLRSGRIPSFGDHRIAMAATALATSLDGMSVIQGGSCAENSFPGFVDAMTAAGWSLEESNQRWSAGGD